MPDNHVPDVWVALELTTPESSIHKILAGWYGGYMGVDSWKMNSGISRIIEHPGHYEVHGYSGSSYVCYKHIERFSNYTHSIFNHYVAEAEKKGWSIKHVDMKSILNTYLHEEH